MLTETLFSNTINKTIHRISRGRMVSHPYNRVSDTIYDKAHQSCSGGPMLFKTLQDGVSFVWQLPTCLHIKPFWAQIRIRLGVLVSSYSLGFYRPIQTETLETNQEYVCVYDPNGTLFPT